MLPPSVRYAAAGLVVLALASTAAVGPAGASGVVAGVVYFGDGTPVAAAQISLSPGGFNTTTGPDGSFRLEVPAGNYTVHASTQNASAESPIQVAEGGTATVVLRVEEPRYVPGPVNVFPFVFLGLSMIAVAAGGFYVNKRMAETGIDFNKSVLGGARVKKPFRRRRKAPPPPSS